MKVKKFILAVVSVVFAYALLSCDVGLGAAVDTQAPTLNVTYPATLSTVRGQFVFGGTCADDQKVTSVTVIAHNSELGKSYGPYAATVADDAKSWTFSFNKKAEGKDSYNGWEMPDGKYTLEAVARDASGKSSGTGAITIDIDNTEPIFILNSPGTTDIKNPTVSGSSFKITGTIADDHSIKYMRVYVYENEGGRKGKLRKSFIEENIETSGGTSVALFKKTDPVYTELYGGDIKDASSIGTKTFFCEIELEDSAYEYNDFKNNASGKTGNVSKKVYLYDSVYKKFQSSSGYGLEAAKIKSIVNETLTEVNGTAAAQIRTEFLNSAAQSSLAFGLNPNANPKYVVQGFDVDSVFDINKTGASSQSISVQVNAGLDGTNVLPETMCVYVFGPFDSVTENIVSSIYNDPAEYAKKNAAPVAVKEANSSYEGSSLATYTFNIKLPKTISPLKTYIVAASGTDADGNDFDNDGTVFAFLGAQTGAAPTLAINTPTNSAMFNSSEDLSVAGTVSYEGGIDENNLSLDWEVTITDENDSNKVVKTYSGTRSDCTVNKDGSWSLSIPADDVPAYDADKKNGKVYTYSVKVTATGSNELKVVAERSFHVDSQPPVLSGPEVTKTVKNAEGFDCVNGTINISGGVDENYRKSFTLTVTDSSGSGVKKEFSYSAGQFSERIDTTEFADGADLIITLTAEDKAGNKSEPSVKRIKIDQSTDRPVVAITNASTAVKAGEIAAGKNLFNSTTNSTLNITVTDDDGISAPVIVNAWALKTDGTKDTTSVTTQKYEDFTVGTTSANLTFNLPNIEGKYAVEVTARDTLYKTATEKNKVNHENTSGITYYVAVDNGAPSLSIESKSGAYQVQDKDFTVTGKVSDSSGARLFVSSENILSIPAASDTKSKEITPNKDTSFTTAVNAGKTSGTRYFVAFDAYGQRSSAEFKWNVDGKSPTMAPGFTFKPDSWYKSRAVVISLPLADGWNNDSEKVIDDPSNISSVIATFTAADGTEKTTPLTLGGAYSADKYENQYYYYSTTLNFDADAEYEVSVTATDNAGNKAVFGPYKYNIDTTAPTVTVKDYVANLTGKEMNDENFAYKIPVTVRDNLSGIKPVTVKKGNEVLTKDTDYTETLTGDVYTFEFKKDVLTTGTYAFTFTAEDNAGNTSEASANVSVDKTAPAITVKGVSPIVVVTENGSKVNKVNGKITVTGTVTDETKLGTTGAVTLNIKNASDTSASDVKKTFDLSGGTYGEWSFVIDTTTLTDNSTYTLEVTAVDAVGNTETKSTTINVDQSTDIPSITPSNYDAGINSADGVGVKGDVIKNLFGTVSNNKLSGTAFDDDGVKTVTVEYREVGTDAYTSKNVIENGTSTTAPFTFALPSKEAKYEVKITVTDTEGNANGTYAASPFYIGVSSGAPALKVDPQTSDYTRKGEVLSVKPNVATTLTASYTVKRETVTETTTETVTVATGTITPDDKGNISLTVPATVKDKDVLAITYTATDIFGQSTSDVHTYTIDNTAPVLASAFCSSNDLKPTVNKKDPASSWYKDESLPFDIKYYDGGCGVERVEYTFTPQGGTAVTGSGIPKIVTVDGKKYYQYTAAISGFAVGTNTLVFTAVDAAGNKSTSTTLNVRCDNVAPSLELVSIDDETAYDGRGKLVNGTKDVKFIVKATDEASGIASVKYGNVEGTADQSGQYSFTIKSKSLATMDVNATATDQAGNTTTTKLFNIILDNVAPVVNITSSLDKDTSTPAVEVNGTIALEGNSNDGSYALTATPVFWYTLTKPTDPVTSTAGWTRIFTGTSDITESSTPTAWKSLPIDTKSAFGTLTDGTHVYVMAAVTDSAQNTGYSPVLDLVVDQNTDRPQIKITSPKSLKDMGKTGTTIWQKNTKVIEGRISDDDGIESLEYSFKDPNDETFDSSIDWIEVTPNGDSWEIEAKEGANKIYFRVTDTEGTTFTSSKTSGLTAPYITDGTNKFGTAAAADSVLYVTVDTTPPVISELKFDTGTGSDTATYTGTLKEVSSLSNTIVGGTTKWLKIRAHATDDNGIKSVTVRINNGAAVEATKGSDEKGEYYERADINLSDDLPSGFSGFIYAVVTATDMAGTTSSTTLNINVDNAAPELKVTYPGTDSASKVTSTVTMKGIASDNNSGIKSIEYKMGPISSSKDWTFVTNQISWEIPFESTAKDDPKNIKTYITDSNISEEETPDSALYKVYVSFRVTDNLGNVNEIDGKESGNYILFDKDGGKPIADVIYPETGATVGGSLTIIGTATDDRGVSEVQVQLDVNGDGIFDEDDYNIIKTWTASDGTTPSMPGLCETYSADWYITATGTNSWKLLVPTMKIAENTALAEKGMSLRARAWDNDETPNTRGWGKTVNVKIDVESPQVENVALVQYKSGSSGETSVSRTYSSGMYITKPETGKEWYLTGTISSTSLSSITITSDTESVNKIFYEKTDPSVTDSKYTFSVRVPIIGDGKTSATINVSSESGLTTKYPVLFSVDSQAPQMYSTDDSLAADKTTSLRLTTSDGIVGPSKPVVNSNVVYTFGDKVKEVGSGLDYIAFYFKRIPDDTVNGTTRVYNPMFNTNGDNRTDIDTSKTEGTSSGDVYINSDGLPVMYMKDATRSTETSLAHTNISKNPNIREGGLIKIGGSYVRISAVNVDEVTFAPAKAESFTEAEFVYAQIVDHKIKEGPTGNDFENVSNDDGDGMIETLEVTGSQYTWTASIFSDRIPDGPVEIHVVTIDKAGNINRGSIATSIQNKRPRIAKVLLGTDLDHNGTYDFYSDSEIKYEGNVTQATYNNRNFGEFNYYSAVDANGVAQSSVTLSSEKFKIKNGMCILPEFIGGNGTLKYNMIVGDRAAEEAQKGTDTLKTLTTGTDSLKVANRDGTKAKIDEVKVNDDSSYFSHFPQGGILLDNEALASHESETPKYFAFTFWDETEETVQGTDSQWALLNIPVIVDVKDDTKPNASFNPFFWNGKGKGNNSLAYDKDGKALGHIELETDLTAALKTSPYGTGPKVSGKIVLRGTASDETLLTGLSVKAAETEIASAKYENGVWSSANGLTVTNVREVDQNGHEVTWELEYETPSAQKDLELTVTATDGGTNSSPEATESTAPALGTKEEKRTALYTVDVVPYVTNVKTMLSTVGGKEEAAWSTYGRTSTGAYVAGQSWANNSGITGEKSGSAETVTLYGFNLAGGTVESSNGGSATLSTVSDTDNSFKFSVSGFKSGDYTVTAVNGIPSINNINSNDSKGSYKGSEAAQKYNRMPNGTTNNNLTDDFKMNIWDIRYDAATSQGGTLKEAVMRIAPGSDKIGFAFTNGASKFSMGGKKDGNSYQIWQSNYADFNNVSFVYDKNGNSYGTATGLDTYPDGNNDFAGRFTFMSSQWGVCNTGDMNDNYQHHQKIRLESIGAKNFYANGEWKTSAVMDTYRFRSPTLATTMHGNSTSVYLAYYDTFNKQIRFRYGTFASDGKNRLESTENNDGDDQRNKGFGQFQDVHGYKSSDQYGNDANKDYTTQKMSFDAHPVDYSLIAGKDARDQSKDTGNVCIPSNSMASTCVAIDAIEGSSTAEDVVVAAWCTGSGVAFAYKKNPYTDNDADSDSANAGTAGYWSKAVEVFSGACEDVSIKADASGAVHISAYNKADQSLVYRYINKDRTTMGDVVTVDSYQIVGSRTQIDVQKEGSYYVPYISYYNPATQKTKLAYLLAGENYSAQGVKDDDTFTGNWEVSVIPTSSDIQEDHTNIGLWKDSSGARRTSVGGTVNNYGSIGDNEGQTSGNGTNNPVVGYATVIGIRGFIETAQMR